MDLSLPQDDRALTRKVPSTEYRVNTEIVRAGPTMQDDEDLAVSPTSPTSPPPMLQRRDSLKSLTSVEPPPPGRCMRFCPKWIKQSNQTIDDLRRINAKLQDVKPKNRWSWVESFWMNSLFGFLILLNALCIGVDLELSDEDGGRHIVMVWVESIFLVCFWGELFLRLLAHGLRKFCVDPWGPFDFAVTLLGSLDAWLLTPLTGGSDLLSGLSALRTLRLLRLARLLRVFRYFKQLARLVKQIHAALISLGWVSLLTLLMVYISVILSLMLLDCNKDGNSEIDTLCRGVGWAFFSHLMAVTAEGYVDALVSPTVALNIAWYPYWMLVVAILNFCMVQGLILGIICSKAMSDKNEEDEEAVNFVHEARAFRQALYTLFELEDANSDGVLDSNELNQLLRSEMMQQIMQAFGIKTDVPPELLITVLGFEHEKYVSFKRFYESCVRVCGASRDIRSFMLQYDVAAMSSEVSNCISRFSKKLKSLENAGVNFRSKKKPLSAIAVLAPRTPIGSPVRASSPEPGASPERKLPPSPVKGSPRKGSPRKGSPVKGSPVKEAAKPVSKPPCICSANLASDFNDAFSMKAQLAKKRLDELERRQEETLFKLGELRKELLGSSGAVCCPKGHLLLPLGTNLHPVGQAEYRYWSCDCADKNGCGKLGQVAGHLTQWRRYHCARCRYDMCEPCYQHRLWGGRPPPDLLSWLPAPPLPNSQWWESAYEKQAPGKQRTKAAKAFAQQPAKGAFDPQPVKGNRV